METKRKTKNSIMGSEYSTTEGWLKSHWRPLMAYMYMLICFMDFVGFPLLSMFLPSILHTGSYIPWKTLTLENGGLIHMAFGAILGISAWTRGTEKVVEMGTRSPTPSSMPMSPNGYREPTQSGEYRNSGETGAPIGRPSEPRAPLDGRHQVDPLR